MNNKIKQLRDLRDGVEKHKDALHHVGAECIGVQLAINQLLKVGGLEAESTQQLRQIFKSAEEGQKYINKMKDEFEKKADGVEKQMLLDILNEGRK